MKPGWTRGDAIADFLSSDKQIIDTFRPLADEVFALGGSPEYLEIIASDPVMRNALAHRIIAANNIKSLEKDITDAQAAPTPAALVPSEPSIILRLDRSQPFNPEKFIGKGWRIVEEDERSLALTEVDLSRIRLETYPLKPGSKIRITGEEMIQRCKRLGYIRLDAAVFQTLLDHQHLIPESWKKTNDWILFDGTVLCSPDGVYNTLYLCWDGKDWDWGYYWIRGGRDFNDSSAALTNPVRS